MSRSRTAGVTRGALPLVVLNNSGTSGLADRARQRFEGGGWKVTSVEENYQNKILSTAAYYDPSVAHARDVASLLRRQFSTIKRVVPKFGGLPAGPIVVVLTADYSPR